MFMTNYKERGLGEMNTHSTYRSQEEQRETSCNQFNEFGWMDDWLGTKKDGEESEIV